MRARGFALIVVLWTVALLSVIAGSFAFAMRGESTATRNLVDRARGAALADAGIRRGILELLAAPSGVGTGWRFDGTVYELPFGGGTIRISIVPEHARIDINLAAEPVIRQLARQVSPDGEGDELADMILDWRDRDRNRRLNGAEDDDFRRAGFAYGARDGPFLTVAELTQLPAVDAEIYARLSELVTVYSRWPKIDPTTASREVLLSIPGLDAAQVERYLLSREERAAEGLGAPVSQLLGADKYLDVASAAGRSRRRVYNITTEGVLPGGAVVSRTAVVRVGASARAPYVVLAWGPGIENALAERPREILGEVGSGT